jgi:acyl-coenzyme A thioesterase PaaI-like protein
LGEIGSGAGAFVRIPGSASLVTAVPGAVGERSSIGRRGPALEVPITSRMGLWTNDGTAEIDISEYVRNSFGSLNGGVLGFVVAAAAEAATGWPAADVTLRYLGQTKVGPARATSRVLRSTASHAVVDVKVEDVGAGGAPLARAAVTTTPPPVGGPVAG